MTQYELCVVLNAKIEEEERASTFNRVKELVERFGGTITKVDEWGKKRLAYEIEKMKDGYFSFIQFDAAPIVPIEIESRIRIMDNVLRFLIVKRDQSNP